MTAHAAGMVSTRPVSISESGFDAFPRRPSDNGRAMEGTQRLEARDASAGAKRFDPEPWRRELLTFVQRMGAAREAEDIVQDAFLRAIAAPPRSHPRAYLYQVALNALRDRRRGEERASNHIELAARDASIERDGGLDPAEFAERRELAEIAWSAVEKLPEQQRAALLLRVQRHMDYDEVALALDCSVATARQHFHLAVKTVRNALARGQDEP
jgi:RNA polymerase sigma-70 factor (ECF subfamily)